MAGTSALELGRLFSLMEGVDPEGLFNAALLRAAGEELEAAGLSAQLPSQLQPGIASLEGLEGLDNNAGLKSGASPSRDMGAGGSTDDEDDKGSVGGMPGGPSVPPRTGSINDRKCTKVLPASSSAPKYKFVVPNEYVYKFMRHLVERPFHMRDMGGKLWDCVLIQRKNKEKYEYMIQGWRRFGEAIGVQEGDTVTIEMVDDTIMQLMLEHTGGASAKKRGRKASGGGAAPLPLASQGGPPPGAPSSFGIPEVQQRMQLMQQAAAMQQRGVEAEASGIMGGQQQMMQGPGRASQQQTMQSGMSMQQQQQEQGPSSQQQQMGYGGGMSEAGDGAQGPQGLLALIQQQQAQAQAQTQQMGMMCGRQQGQGSAQPLTPRSLSAHLANGLTGPLGQLAGGQMNEAHLADLTAVINHLEKRQRVGDGPPSGSGAIQLLSDVADLDKLMQENMGLREELRMMQAKIATLETGVLNIKSVLTRNTDPGLIAMTGVINLLNQMELPDFLPELGTIGRVKLTGLCSEVRRNLNGVLRMVWILRSLPDDVQQHNLGGAPINSGGGP